MEEKVFSMECWIILHETNPKLYSGVNPFTLLVVAKSQLKGRFPSKTHWPSCPFYDWCCLALQKTVMKAFVRSTSSLNDDDLVARAFTGAFTFIYFFLRTQATAIVLCPFVSLHLWTFLLSLQQEYWIYEQS